MGAGPGPDFWSSDAPEQQFGRHLLGCDCGEWWCWPLTAQVIVMHDKVRWSGFRTGHRDWDLGGLGPFELVRDDYVRALSALGPHLPE